MSETTITRRDGSTIDLRERVNGGTPQVVCCFCDKPAAWTVHISVGLRGFCAPCLSAALAALGEGRES